MSKVTEFTGYPANSNSYLTSFVIVTSPDENRHHGKDGSKTVVTLKSRPPEKQPINGESLQNDKGHVN